MVLIDYVSSYSNEGGSTPRGEGRVAESPASYHLKGSFGKWQSKHPERSAATIISESANFLSLCISQNAYLVITKNCWHWASAVSY